MLSLSLLSGRRRSGKGELTKSFCRISVSISSKVGRRPSDEMEETFLMPSITSLAVLERSPLLSELPPDAGVGVSQGEPGISRLISPPLGTDVISSSTETRGDRGAPPTGP